LCRKPDNVAGLLIIVAFSWPVAAQQPEIVFPASGNSVAALAPIDSLVVTMMSRHGIPGAAMAIAKNGKLVFARGYGWSDLATNEKVQPDTLFGVASLSKTIT